MIRHLGYTSRASALSSGGAASRSIALVIALSLVTGRGAIAAGCTALKSDAVTIADSIALRVAPGLAVSIVSVGIAYWRSCANYEEGFPELIVGGAGTQTLEIRYLGSRGDSACGEFRGRTITLYRWALAPDGRRVQCGSIAQNLAHELGHALGLRDAREAAECRHHIMSRIGWSNRKSRSIGASECQAVGQRWLTRLEQRTHDEIWNRVSGESR